MCGFEQGKRDTFHYVFEFDLFFFFIAHEQIDTAKAVRGLHRNSAQAKSKSEMYRRLPGRTNEESELICGAMVYAHNNNNHIIKKKRRWLHHQCKKIAEELSVSVKERHSVL